MMDGMGSLMHPLGSLFVCLLFGHLTGCAAGAWGGLGPGLEITRGCCWGEGICRVWNKYLELPSLSLTVDDGNLVIAVAVLGRLSSFIIAAKHSHHTNHSHSH